MAVIRILDQANQFRIEITGRFAGEAVEQVASAWECALLEPSPRTVTLDISELSGYDSKGFKVLHAMYKHGTRIAAGNPVALAFLNEISSETPEGLALIYKAPAPPAKTTEPAPNAPRLVSKTKAAAASK